jgi:tRNA nucleotidyltransferase/poly(A) polymerase
MSELLLPDLPEQNQSPYAGRWVAKVRGKIIAQGDTREQAIHAAKQSRPKENPEIIFMPQSKLFKAPLLNEIQSAMSGVSSIYLVGGAVRDLMLGRDLRDFDFAVPWGSGIKLARQLANKIDADFFPLSEDFDTGRVIVIRDDGSRDVIDFAGFRGADLEADLRGRDFTLNATAIDLHTEQLIDPLKGANDLREKVLRACSPTSSSDDPVRILRGVRLAAAFGFRIDIETRKQMKAAVEGLSATSPERLRDEFFKILEGPQPDTAIRALDLIGALNFILPELSAMKNVEQSAPHVHDVWTHTLALLRYLDMILAALAPQYKEESASDLLNGLTVLKLGRYRNQFADHFAKHFVPDRSRRALLFFTALYHDAAKPNTKTFENGRIRFLGHDEQGPVMLEERGRSLALSNDEIERAKIVIRNHMRIHNHTNRLHVEKKEISRRAIYRFFRDSGEAGVDLILLAMADFRATYDHTLTQELWTACLDVCRTLLENYWEKPEEIVAPPKLLNGDDLIKEIRMKPGPEIGQLLELIREGQAAGKISTREEAIAFALGWLSKK